MHSQCGITPFYLLFFLCVPPLHTIFTQTLTLSPRLGYIKRKPASDFVLQYKPWKEMTVVFLKCNSVTLVLSIVSTDLQR